MTAPLTLTFDLPDETATAALAKRLAGRARVGDVIALQGELGSGKTSFARAFIRAFAGHDNEVPSPTFTLVETYSSVGKPAVWHFDLYRLTRPDDALELGIEEALVDGISLIEWPERLGQLLPRDHLMLALEEGPGPHARRAQLTAVASWVDRVAGLLHD